MRVVFATDRIGPLSSSRAGEALATGWQRRRPQDELAVVPVGAAGAGLVEAYADLVGADVDMTPSGDGDDLAVLMNVVGPDATLVGVDGPTDEPVPGVDTSLGATSTRWGEAIARAAALPTSGAGDGPNGWTLAVDLGGCVARDAGAGLLASLGAVADVPLDRGAAALTDVSSVDLAPVRALLAVFSELVAVVPADDVDRVLLGMRGITSLHGVALREAGLPWDPGELLRADATLQRFTRLIGPELPDRPGLGACGGAAYALAALGARVVTGPEWLAGWSGLAATMAAADLVVTGSGAYDFVHRGGEAVEAVVRLAGEAMRPVVAVAGLVTISAREMRSRGLEAAYALREATPGTVVHIDAAELTAMGERLARTWTA